MTEENEELESLEEESLEEESLEEESLEEESLEEESLEEESLEEESLEEESLEEVTEEPSLSLQDALTSIASVEENDDLDISENVQELITKISEAKRIEDVLPIRRHIRYRLFRIREGGRICEAYDKGLKAYIERQFTQGITWKTFTFEWDVAPNNPLRIITKDILNTEWRDLGGGFDGADRMVPPAFTKQA
jgi:hypothetical protein